MLAYTRSILLRWGGLTLLFAIVMAAAPGFWLRLMYGPRWSNMDTFFGFMHCFMSSCSSAPRFARDSRLWSLPCRSSGLTCQRRPLPLPLRFPWQSGWIERYNAGMLGTQVLFQGIVACALIGRSRRAALAGKGPGNGKRRRLRPQTRLAARRSRADANLGDHACL